MSNTQPIGQPMVARAMFGKKGWGSTVIPKYEMRRYEITDREDRHVDHYVGNQWSHRDTTSRYTTRTEDRMDQVGIEHVHHETISIDFEYPENDRMEIPKPFWARHGQLVYVASHRGVGSYVYELYCPEVDKALEIRSDTVKPIQFGNAVVIGLVIYVLQIKIGYASSWEPGAAAATIWLGLQVVFRAWRRHKLHQSRIKAVKIIAKLLDKDNPEEIKKRIRDRVSG